MVKLSDYGLPITGNLSGTQLTPWHSPAVTINGESNLKSDVWSVGITLIELAKSDEPDEDGVCWGGLKERMIKNDPPISSEKWYDERVDFVAKCMAIDANERWSVSELMEVGGYVCC